MTNKPKLEKECETCINLPDVLDISVTEILILQFLLRTRSSISRKSLLENLNSFLGHSNFIVTQTFYNKIDKLAEKGLLATSKTKKGKIDKVWSIEKSTEVMKIITELSFYGSLNFFDQTKAFVKEFSPILQNIIKKEKLDSLLIINLEEGIDLRTIELIGENSEDVYLVSDDETYERYLARNLPSSVQQTKHANGIIREADGFFEATIIIGYECYQAPQEVEIDQWVNEAIRVTQPTKPIIITSIEKLPDSNHFLIQQLANDLKSTKFVRDISKEDLSNELEKKLENVQIFSYGGLVIGWGFKPE